MLDFEETLAFMSCDATELLVEMLRQDGTTEAWNGEIVVGDHVLPFANLQSWNEAVAELRLLQLIERRGPFRFRMTLAGAKVAMAVDPMLVAVRR